MASLGLHTFNGRSSSSRIQPFFDESKVSWALTRLLKSVILGRRGVFVAIGLAHSEF